MDCIRLISLYSGSSGNAFLLLSPAGNLLIDGGKSARRLTNALKDVGVCPEEISALLLTHEHNDHITALPVFLGKHPMPLYLPERSAYAFACLEKLEPLLHPEPPCFSETLPGGIVIKSFPTLHDSHGSVGYRVEIPLASGKPFCFGYATDLGRVTDDVKAGLSGCDAVVLESNHDIDMLLDGPYPYYLKRRIRGTGGHLSNEESATLAAELVESGTKVLFLAHLSRENNRPELAYDACLSSVGERAKILVADPEAPVEWKEELL